MKWLRFAYDAFILVMIVLSLPLTLPLAAAMLLLFPRSFPALTHQYYPHCACAQCKVMRPYYEKAK